MALLNIGEDPWVREYESCEKLQRDIMEMLTQRQGVQRQSFKYNELSANIRLRLKQYNNEVSQLNQKLETVTNIGSITAAESERRNRQIELLHSKGIQMKRLFDEQVVSKAKEERDQLMGARSIWGDSEPSISKPTTSNYTDDMLAEQRRILSEQDKGLENLSQIISRQKDIAKNIKTEVDFHNDILDDLGNVMDRTESRVRDETQHIAIVDTKDKTCIYWVVIILLFLSIIIVWAI